MKPRMRTASIGALMVVVVLSALAMGVAPPLGGRTRVRGPVATVPVPAVQPRDRFVIVAPADLDPAMVVQARADLDVPMVFDPETRRQGSVPMGLAPAAGPWVQQRLPAPAPGGPRSGRWFR
jgi:hypothetical protein